MKHFYMKRHYNKLWALLLCLCVLPGSLTYAAERTITKYPGAAINLSSVNNGDKVVIVGDTLETGINDWWHLRSRLGSISFEIELQTDNKIVPDYGFDGTSNLTAISMPNITVLGARALAGSGVSTIDFPNVEIVGNSAFEGSSLTNVILPHAKTIKNDAFSGCASLMNVDVPDVLSIEYNAFLNCTSLVGINSPKVENIGNNIFSNCSNLTNVSFPNLQTMGDNVFISCSALASASLPKVKNVGNQAFQYCVNLRNVDLLNVLTIGDQAFSDCPVLTDIDLPNALTIGKYAFNLCSSLAVINFSNVQTIDEGAFKGTALTSVVLPNVLSIGEYAFQNCTGITTLSIPKVNIIQEGTFNGCTGLTALYMPEIQTIGNWAFGGCTNIELAILHNLSLFGEWTFTDCPSLKYMELGAPPDHQAGSGAFGGTTGPVLIVVPDTNAYKPFPLPYPPYSGDMEVHLRRVSTESRMFRPDSLETLLPLRNPNPALAAGGTFVWKKDGYPISGASGSSYMPTSPGWYTLEFTHGGTVTLLSVYLAAETVEVPDSRARFAECNYTLVLTFTPSNVDRTVTVSTRGSAAAYVMDAASEKLFKDGVTFKLPKNKTMLEIPYEVVPGMGNDNQVQFIWEVSDFPIVYDTDVFTLYDKHTITHRYFRPTVGFPGFLEVEIAGGSPFMERSRDGGETWEWARDPATGATLPFSQSQISNIDVPYLIFRQSNTCTANDTIRLYDDSDPNVIMRTVSIPAVTDAVCSLEEGVYPVESRKDFTFTLTGLKAGYVPQVSTSRVLLPDSEGLLTVRNADGSYTITILGVQEETIVTIDFTVGTETIESARVWAAGGMLYLVSDHNDEVLIHTLSGALVQHIRLSAGETYSLSLAKGYYIVTVGKRTYKVIL